MADKDEKKPEDKEDKKEEKPVPKDNLVVTKHTVRIGGQGDQVHGHSGDYCP